MANEIIEIFSKSDKEDAFRRKKIMFFVWLSLLIVVVGVIVTLGAINLTQINKNYDRSLQTPATVISVILGAVFAGASMFFFAIKYRLTRKYCRMLKEMDAGLKDVSVVKFTSYDFDTVFKDGVYFYTMIVESKPLRRGDITERHILVERTVPPPEFAEGQGLTVTTHANILVSYEYKGEILKPKTKTVPDADNGESGEGQKTSKGQTKLANADENN